MGLMDDPCPYPMGDPTHSGTHCVHENNSIFTLPSMQQVQTKSVNDLERSGRSGFLGRGGRQGYAGGAQGGQVVRIFFLIAGHLGWGKKGQVQHFFWIFSKSFSRLGNKGWIMQLFFFNL